MSETSIGELIRQAKGEDRSLRQYARDSGVDVAIVSKIINGTYIPKKQGIYEALTSPQAAPRGGVTCQQLIAAASTSGEYRSGVSAGMTVGALATLSDIPSSAMIKILQARGIAVDSSGLSEAARSALKPEDARRIQHLQSDIQRFTATANGIILGSLGREGLTFQLIHTDRTEVDGVPFDTCVKLMNHAISDFLIRYVFISDEEALSLPLAVNTVRRAVEELVFLKPAGNRAAAVVTNHPEAYDNLCAYKNRLSYNGELTVILFDPDRAMILRQEYLSHYISGDPVPEILLT